MKRLTLIAVLLGGIACCAATSQAQGISVYVGRPYSSYYRGYAPGVYGGPSVYGGYGFPTYRYQTYYAPTYGYGNYAPGYSYRYNYNYNYGPGYYGNPGYGYYGW